MKKIISMLLAVSMSLSVMCSSFTVTAVDGNNTAAQTESTVQSSSTVNEKIAEKSNDCGINSVEVSGNTATVSYRASKDCTVIVGIYEDDDTDGTHMLTFGTANVKADETTAVVTIDNLPQYFYLKAYLVDSESNRPLAVAYENSSYIYSDDENDTDLMNLRENIIAVETPLCEIVGSDEYQNASVDERNDIIVTELKKLKDDKLITKYWLSGDNSGYFFNYTLGGFGGVALNAFATDLDGFNGENEIPQENNALITSSPSIGDREFLPDDRKLNIKLFDGFEDIPDETGKLDDRRDYYIGSDGIKKNLEKLGNVTVSYDDTPTVQDFLDFGNIAKDPKGPYDIVIFAMHGACTKGHEGDIGWKELYENEKDIGWALQLNESYECVNYDNKNEPAIVGMDESYLKRIKEYEIARYINIDDRAYIFVTTKFFKNPENVKNWNIRTKAVYLSACASFGCKYHGDNTTNYTYANNILSIPCVKIVSGYHCPVESSYNRKILEKYITELYKGKTASLAMGLAQLEYGFNDGCDEGVFEHKRLSTPELAGDKSFRLWEITGVELTKVPKKTDYEYGEELNLSGGEITLTFNNDQNCTSTFKLTDKEIADYIQVNDYDSRQKGTQYPYIQFTDDRGKPFDTEVFPVTVTRTVKKIKINTMPNKTVYYLNDQFDITGLTIDIEYKDGEVKTIDATYDMISGFDSSTLGTKALTVTYKEDGGSATVKFNVKVEKTVCRIEFIDSPTYNLWQDDRVSEGGWWTNTSYKIREYFSDGTNDTISFRLTFNSDGSVNGYYEGTTILGDDGHGGKIKIEDYDINKTGVQEIKATYCRADGTPDPNVEPVFIWRGIHSGKSYATSYTSPPSVGDLRISSTERVGDNSYTYYIGEAFDPSDYWLDYDVYMYDSERNEYRFRRPWGNGSITEMFEKDDDGKTIIINGHYVPKSEHLLSNYHYLGGFDSRYPTVNGKAYFEYQGYVFTVSYTVAETGTVSALSEYDYDFEENMQYDDYSGYDDMEYDTPDVTEAPAETETPDNTDENTDETDSTEPTETEVTEPVDTETTDTEQQPEETTVAETAEVEENSVFAIDNNGVFGFGRAAAKKSAQFANLHKNDIYNCYVVKSASADILGKDNLLFVGQTSSDGNGSLSFEYETTTGEDGTIILRPMSDDPTTPDNPDKPTTPDTPNQPAAPDNGGNSSNTTNTGVVAPFGGTNTQSLTVTVENKVTGKTSKAKGQKTGGSAEIKLGTENNGYFANVYTTDGEYICSTAIENGRAAFTVQGDVKLKIVIDSIAYGEDVSSEAGVFGDSASESLPYAAITVMIAVAGIYLKKRSGKKAK